MGSYSDTAWGYDEESLGLDPETKLKFVPTDKELKLFKEEKTNLYKGTWMVCFIYGLSALALLSVVFFTDWGKTYIYEKFLPAVVTYVLGAILIILYLVFSIFALKPRKILSKLEPIPICPDYWKLEQVTPAEKKHIYKNIKEYNNINSTGCTAGTAGLSTNNSISYIINNDEATKITEDSQALEYKCKPDKFVFGEPNDILKMNNYLYKNSDKAESEFKYIKNNENNNEYLYKVGDNKDNTKYITYDGEVKPASDQLKKYAQIAGMYKNSWKEPEEANKNIAFNQGLYSNIDINSTGREWEKYPLICNQIYPGILDELEQDKGDKLKCELSKVCGISWSKLDCYQQNDGYKSLL